MKKKYRIVQDGYLGYEVQVWRWWFPFWIMAGYANTFASIEAAERFARGQKQDVVKNLGSM